MGEQRDRQRQRRKRIIIGGLIIIGFAGGFVTGFTQADSLFTGAQAWPAPLSIGLAVAYVSMLLGGGYAMSRQTDEFELQTQYKAVAVAAAAYILIYPPWFLLWMADLVREPMHGALFIVFWGSLALSSLYYRFR
ncbi:MAG: hypothetical protein ACXW2T_01595 [Allosphingosinicella sp.]